MQQYNRHTTRLQTWDYSQNGYYFVTICTQNRECIFGDIKNGKMILNDAGKIIDKWWLELSNKFDRVGLDVYQIMPNHFHGIIIIRRGFIYETRNHELLKSNHHMGLINQTPTLGHIIRYFKAKTSFELHANGLNQKIWQRNYYDRIIRNGQELEKIKKYVSINPLIWYRDRNNLQVKMNTTNK